MAFDIVAVGHLINETIVFPGRESRPVLGSPVAYSMACAASLGKKVGILSRIGSDYPERLLAPLVELGVDIQGIITSGDVSTNNQLVYDQNGNKKIRYLSRAPEIRFEDLPPTYCDAQIMYVCPMDWDLKPATVKALRDCTGLLAADLGGFGGAHSPPNKIAQLMRDPDSLQSIVSHVDIVKASDEDCQRLTGSSATDLDDFAAQLLEWGSTLVIVTRGSAGAIIFTSSRRFEIPALPGQPIDPTGGGDTFMAGFLVSYLDTRDPWEAGLFGAATALLVIEGTGGVVAERMPQLSAVRERLQRCRATLNV